MFGYLDGLAEDLLPYVLAIGCVGLCLVGGLVFLIYWFAYKTSKQPPPAPDNDENSKD